MSRLQTLIAEAEAMLPEAEQAHLAEIVESFLAARDGSDLVSPEELEELLRIEAEPDDVATPEEVAAVFRRRG
jgi:hypothetical protein